MLDIRFIRENPELVRENIKKKFQDAKLPLVDEVLELDEKKRAAITEASELRAQRNALSKQVGMLMGQAKKDPNKLEEAEAIKAKVKAQAERLAELEKLEVEYEEKLHQDMLQIPNIIDPSVPIGPDDSYNVEVQRFGEPKTPDFEIPYHTEIMERFDGVDMDAAGRVSGAAAMVATIMSICPIMRLDDAGAIKAYGKVRGKKKAVETTIEAMAKHAQGGENYDKRCYVCHSQCPEDAQMLIDGLEARFPRIKGKIRLCDIGTIIGSHSGPGTVAGFFYGDERPKMD